MTPPGIPLLNKAIVNEVAKVFSRVRFCTSSFFCRCLCISDVHPSPCPISSFVPSSLFLLVCICILTCHAFRFIISIAGKRHVERLPWTAATTHAATTAHDDEWGGNEWGVPHDDAVSAAAAAGLFLLSLELVSALPGVTRHGMMFLLYWSNDFAAATAGIVSSLSGVTGC